ncbi:WG repeat-containing protein [Psychrobacter frigidicola]|uniref:WG repeat-containing protein n=1 Tax=Psychrobacter frigidicola TaxID=45611 RepID=UPI001919CC18|nr:WG repeat-containing protein [Psychrobacter frigidicola]
MFQSPIGSASKSSNKLLSVNPSRLIIGTSVVLSMLFTMPTAQAASCKLPKSYYKNVTCTANSGYFLASKDFGAPVALIDSRGKPVVDLSRYQKVDANKIAGGLFPVLRNSRVGYVNMQGREVIPTVYDMLSGGQGWARPVSEGRIVVKKAGKYGVISTGNQTIVPFSAAISDIDNYRGGVARVRKNKAISLLDKNGNLITNPNSKGTNHNDSAQASATNKKLDKPASRDKISTLAPPKPSAGFNTLQPHQQDGKWGFVDEQNVIMITYSFDEVRPFSEGLAGVRVDDKWGFLNLGGELVIPFGFDDNGIIASDSDKDAPSFVFKNGKAWVGSLKNGAKMCIDKEGAYVSCR